MRALSVRRKLIVACGVIALITGAVGGGALWAVSAVNRSYQMVAHESLPAVTFLVEADRDMQRAAMAERTLAFMGRSDSLAARESSGGCCPGRYLPVRMPCASGDQTIWPMPSAAQSGNTSRSGSR